MNQIGRSQLRATLDSPMLEGIDDILLDDARIMVRFLDPRSDCEKWSMAEAVRSLLSEQRTRACWKAFHRLRRALPAIPTPQFDAFVASGSPLSFDDWLAENEVQS